MRRHSCSMVAAMVTAPFSPPLLWHRLSLALALGLVAAGCAASAVRADPHPALLVGTSGDYPPFSEWREQGPQGFSVALLEAFASEQGQALTWVRFRWPELVRDLQAGSFSLAASGITVRPERSVAGRYTVPVARNGAVLLLRRPSWAPASAGIPADMESARSAVQALDRPELRVAVNQGGHLERVARGLFRQAQVLAIPDNAAVREALASSRVDAALSNSIEAPRWAEGLTGVELLGPLTRDVVALYVHPEQSELATRIDSWLLAQEQRGALGRLRERYLGQGVGGPVALPVEALLATTAERLAVMPWVAAAKQRAGLGVEDAAQEARVLESAHSRVREAAAALGVEPPPDEAVTAFFRAQMDAAKAMQQRAHVEEGAPAFSLERELRPAVARITSRMAALVAQVPPGLERESVARQVHDWLGGSGLQAAELERLTEALVGLSARVAATPGSQAAFRAHDEVKW